MSTAVASADPAPVAKPRRQRRKSVPASSTSSEQLTLPLDASADPPSPPEPTPPPKRRVYVARKKITIDGQIRKPGDVVPEADSLPRVESWVRSGYLNEEWR